MTHRILIADDEPAVLSTLQQELQSRGFLVMTATNGQAAFQTAKKNPPDLIILDVAMPMATGLKAYETLRKEPSTQRIPIIFLTGRPSAEVYPTVEQGSLVAHLKKPVDIDDLLSLIRQFLPQQ